MSKQAPTEIEQVQHLRVPLDAIFASPDNYNQHPPEQIHDLKMSLRRFGQVKDSVTRKSANGYMLIAGHGITQAARELLLEDPEACAHLKEWNIVVVPSHWTDLDARAYMVSDNETAKKSSLTMKRLYGSSRNRPTQALTSPRLAAMKRRFGRCCNH